MMTFLTAVLVTFLVFTILVPAMLTLAKVIGLYAIVFERTCRVYVLFGRVIGVIDEPGLHILPFRLGPSAFLVNWMGQCLVVDMRLDQEYLRSPPVHSEGGAPVGSGVRYYAL